MSHHHTELAQDDLPNTVRVQCLYCRGDVVMPRVKGVDYVIYPVIHSEHEQPKTK